MEGMCDVVALSNNDPTHLVKYGIQLCSTEHDMKGN